MENNQTVAVIGGGLVGALLAVYLRKRGFGVDLYEKWPDMRNQEGPKGRSINLVLTKRGLGGLAKVGLAEGALKLCVPVKGRMMHAVSGKLTFTPYGKENEWNNSISRSDLNKYLLSVAESEGARLHFSHPLQSADFSHPNPADASKTGVLLTFAPPNSPTVSHHYSFVIGADGGGSALRREMNRVGTLEHATEDILPFVYKEIIFPALGGNDYPMEKDCLHIWPRGEHMLMGLADLGGSFTGTFYLRQSGANSLEQLQNREDVVNFFNTFYADAIPLTGGIDNLVAQFQNNPNGLLGTVRCKPWQLNSRVMLIGDAAHAIVPFFGQGCNCGFEDCLIFDQILESNNNDLSAAIPEFSAVRPTDSNAIADLALENFVEMRERVADPVFLLKKKIEHEMETRLPRGKFRSMYAMVVYSHIPYSLCQKIGHVQQEILTELCGDVGGVDEVDFDQALKLVEERVTPLVKAANIDLDF